MAEETVELSEEERENIKSHAASGLAFEDIPVEITAILGTADINIANLLKVGRGAVIELNRKLGDPLELRCQNRSIAEGEVFIKEDNSLAIDIEKMLNTNSDHDS